MNQALENNTMKTENTSAAIQNSEAKQAWTAPTLTTLAVSLETNAAGMTGGDGMNAGTNAT